MVEGRDAIYKEFLFKDFNEVIVHFFTTIRPMYILLLELHDRLFHLSTSSSSVLDTIMAS